jgi:hypothetical protein
MHLLTAASIPFLAQTAPCTVLCFAKVKTVTVRVITAGSEEQFLPQEYQYARYLGIYKGVCIAGNCQIAYQALRLVRVFIF